MAAASPTTQLPYHLLWPNERIQCVVSVGTGKYVPRLEVQPADSASLKTKLTKIIQSATDTEGRRFIVS
jgi:calcium-independent phospholipase A2-gamma